MAQRADGGWARALGKRPGVWGLLIVMLASAVLLVAGGEVSPLEAQIKPNADDDIFVLQRKPMLRRNRVELAPSFGLTVNDSLIRQFEVGGTLTYHINESFWVAGSVGWLDLGEFGGETDAYFDVLDKTNSAPELVELKLYGGGQFGYVPLQGKFALFNSAIVYYDASLYLGAGYQTHLTDTSGGEVGAVAGELGAKVRIYLTRWLSVYVDAKDRFVPTELKNGNSISQFVIVSGGVSMFVPFGFKYTTER